MLCDSCGAVNPTTAKFCWRCGKPVMYVAPPPVSNPADNAGMRLVLPVGRSGLAIAAGYAGLFALAMFPAPIALILGIAALNELKRKPELHGAGRAWFGIIMGTLGTIWLLIFCVGLFLRH